MTIKLIAGLANPGKKYAITRHNAGAWFIRSLAKHYQQTLRNNRKFYGYTGQIVIRNTRIRMLIPTIFMNLNGIAVAKIATSHHIKPEEILVAHDEMNLLPGQVRLKHSGSHGGHNGLKSVISHLGNCSQFFRLRIGIGHPGDREEVTNFVLGQPSTSDLQVINGVIDTAIFCTETIVQDTVKAMNYLHKYRPN